MVEDDMFRIAGIFLLIIALSLMTEGCGKISNDYFPLQTGTIWKYHYVNDGETGDMTVKVLEQVKLDEGRGTILLCERGESRDDDAVELFEIKGGSVLAYKRLHPLAHYRDITMSPPQQILKMPPVQGESWEWQGKIFGSASSSRFTVLPKEKVRIGKRHIEAVKIMEKGTTDHGSLVDYRWYAPGIGLVRRESKVTRRDGKEEVSVLELVDFEEGKGK
jgi:hypothetical protein